MHATVALAFSYLSQVDSLDLLSYCREWALCRRGPILNNRLATWCVDKFQAILTSKLSCIVCADLEDNLTTQSHRTNSDLILSTSFTTHPESPFPSQDAYLPPSVREVTTRDISQQ
ncbi:hypothetical protein E2P81_ATG06988 [Venturia nashicola]|nr:hypothetical protein E2P81_ATG06988 [Venturia nashicola]